MGHMCIPRAKHILEAQPLLMGLLKKTVEGRLEGVSGVGSCTKFMELAMTGFRRCVGAEAWSTFCNQAFSSPKFDMQHLLDLARSRAAEAINHLWLLQTDPAYFQYHIKVILDGGILQEAVLKNKEHNKWSFTSKRA